MSFSNCWMPKFSFLYFFFFSENVLRLEVLYTLIQIKSVPVDRAFQISFSRTFSPLSQIISHCLTTWSGSDICGYHACGPRCGWAPALFSGSSSLTRSWVRALGASVISSCPNKGRVSSPWMMSEWRKFRNLGKLPNLEETLQDHFCYKLYLIF